MTRSSLRQNHRTIFRYCHAMLEVRAETAVDRNRSPLVAQNSRLGLAVIHHGLDRDDHALAQSRSMAARPTIRNLRLFVQPRPDAVSYKLTHHAESGDFYMFLHRRAHIADRVADPRLLDSPVQRRFSHFEQLL